MYEVFKEFEEIDEVIIPSKRDIQGKHYEFVRFLNAENKRLLATKLDNVFIGSHKLFANLPRFQITRWVELLEIRGEISKVISGK